MWTKLSDDFADDCARAQLSDAAVRTHVEGLLWTMRREGGGHLDRIAQRRALESPLADQAIVELIDAGFWRRTTDGGLQIVHAMEHQIEPEVLKKRRANTAERVRRHRRKRAGVDDHDDSSNPVTPRDTDTATERVTRDGTGRVGTGQAEQLGPPTSPTERSSEEPVGWWRDE